MTDPSKAPFRSALGRGGPALEARGRKRIDEKIGG
jgi:hypothetical protein